MQYLSEVIAFVLGLVLMYFINLFRGFANEQGKQIARGIKESPRKREKKSVYEFIKHADSRQNLFTKDIKDKALNNKKDIDDVLIILKELEQEGWIRQSHYDQETKEMSIWRYVK
jgi:hypothetical protein